MIRLSKPDDTTELIAIAQAIGFQTTELDELRTMLGDYFSNNSNTSQDSKTGRFWLTDEDESGVVGVAYCEPERMTDQTWNLLLIAIHPNFQQRGRGGQLLGYVEQILKNRDGRLLLVETLASFDHARAFYRKCGFEEEAYIRDFYATGEDKVVYRKLLSPT